MFELCFGLGSKGSTPFPNSPPSLSRHFAGLGFPLAVFEFFPRGTRYFWIRRRGGCVCVCVCVCVCAHTVLGHTKVTTFGSRKG